jgi:dihydroneopterin aldolase
MLTVSLSGVRFKAPIGLYPQEALIENDIVINISVSIPALIDDLPLIDYTILHALVSEAILEPTSFLETIVQRIVHKVFENYPESKLSVAVRKLHPPMLGRVDYSEVKWES